MEGSIPRPLAGWDIHGFYTLEDLDIGKMKEEACTRWLRPNEIHAILCNYYCFNINVKPVELPPSGTILLYDRKMLRNFRKDGHNWKKKNDGKTVKEAHEHLKVGTLDRIHVYYAHGQDNPKFVRRIYWLLDKKLEHIVLVHYREVLEDNANSCLATPKECKGALSFSNRMLLGSPFTPVNSHSSSFYSETSVSKVFSEEIDSEADHALDAGSGTSLVSRSTEYGSQIDDGVTVTDHVLRLHEINTLDWEELLDSNKSPEPRNDGVSSFDQQRAFELTDSRSPEHRLLNHNTSSIEDLSNTVNGGTFLNAKQPNNSYLQPMEDQNVQSSSFETIDTNFQRKDFETEKVVSDDTMEMLGKNLQSQDSFERWMKSMPNDSPGSFDVLAHEISKNLQSQDSFERWMKSMPNDSPGPFDVLAHESSALTDNGLGATVVMDQSPFQEQAFNITDISPQWAFSIEETKIMVIGYFHEAHAYLAQSNLYCVFGDKFVPAEKVQFGVFRCMTLPSTPGVVNFYLSLDGRKPISQILSFEYRSVSTNQMVNEICFQEDKESKWEDLQLQSRLAHLLFASTNTIAMLSGKVTPNAVKEARKFKALTHSYDKDWMNSIEFIRNKGISYSQANHNLFELTLKNKLHEWLLERVVEGCKPTALDHQGQGVIHLCAMLGYGWAIYPFSRSGLSLDFRDAHGWTALHWAAHYGREQIVASLLSAGANPSLVTDPTPECPGGCTAADLASMQGHDGLAAYLAEQGLRAHFNAMSISGNISGSLQPITTNIEPSEILSEEDQLMRDSLAAYRAAADAAARIQSALREHALKVRTKAVQLVNPETEALNIISAMKIQHAYRKYNSHKKMAAAVKIQHRFRTWKIRKDFLNMRRQAIRIQAAYRGHLTRKQYCKILWSVGVLEKAIIRWRQKRKGLRGLQVEPTEPLGEKQVQDDVEEDFYQISRKHAEERVERSVIRVQAMFRSYQAQKEYHRLKLAFDNAKSEYDELLDSFQQ